MGDRAVVWVRGAPAALYVHNLGSQVRELLLKAAPAMRRGSPHYSQARLTAAACEMASDPVLGVGVWGAPTDRQNWEDYSPGDAGVFVIDPNTGKIETHAGYGWYKDPLDAIELAAV